MATFVVYDIQRFPDNGNSFKSPETYLRPASVRPTDALFTRLELTGPSVFQGFDSAVMTHRRKIQVGPGRSLIVQGQAAAELVEQISFAVYFDREERLFICRAGKGLARSAVGRLNRELGQLFRLTKVRMDFDEVRAQAKSITGAWFRRKQEVQHIRREAIFGQELDASPEFSTMSGRGECSSLSAVMPFGGLDMQASISAGGSFYFKEQYRLELCIDFLRRFGTPPFTRIATRQAKEKAKAKVDLEV